MSDLDRRYAEAVRKRREKDAPEMQATQDAAFWRAWAAAQPCADKHPRYTGKCPHCHTMLP